LQECKFKCLLVKAVDESLSCLGDSAKCSIYFHLEYSFGIKKDEIPKKPEIFAEKLEALLKDGSCFIERLIIKRLYEGVGLEFEYKENYSFSDYINEVRDLLVKQVKIKSEKEAFKCRKRS